ncbi:hypothetical protein RFI_36275, partial [Reticulomyxa filosa]
LSTNTKKNTRFAIRDNESSTRQHLSAFVANMETFYKKFVHLTSNENIVDWGFSKKKVKIVGVEDIEECIWSPMFGIQGQIDATLQCTSDTNVHSSKVKVKVKVSTQTSAEKKTSLSAGLVPFELKTGKETETAKLQARAQLAMYSLLISDRYDIDLESVDGGLLYYLKTGNLMGIPLPHNEIRALLIRRNFLAHYLRDQMRKHVDSDLV